MATPHAPSHPSGPPVLPADSFLSKNLEQGKGSSGGGAGHHQSNSRTPAPVTKMAALRAALLEQQTAAAAQAPEGGGGVVGGGSNSFRPAPVVVLHDPSAPEMARSDKKLRVSLDVERVWACLTAAGGPAGPVHAGLPGPASLPSGPAAYQGHRASSAAGTAVSARWVDSDGGSDTGSEGPVRPKVTYYYCTARRCLPTGVVWQYGCQHGNGFCPGLFPWSGFSFSHISHWRSISWNLPVGPFRSPGTSPRPWVGFLH